MKWLLNLSLIQVCSTKEQLAARPRSVEKSSRFTLGLEIDEQVSPALSFVLLLAWIHS